MEVLRRCPLAIVQRLVHCAIALSTAVLDRVTKTMSVAPLLTNNLDNSKQKTSNLLSPAPPPYSWSLLGKSEGPAPPPSSKISWSFDLAWNPWTQIISGVSFITAHVAYARTNRTQIVWIVETGHVCVCVLPRADAPQVKVHAGTLCCFHSLISTQTFRRALTASLDSCAEIKSVPSVASPNRTWVWRKVPESDARSVF